jgi:D-3-phosphoglycerate dehydrogenase
MATDSRPIILVIGDPLVSAATIAAPLHQRLADDYTIVEHEWAISLDELVNVNRTVEQGGPGAVTVDDLPDVGFDRVAGVVTQFHPLTAGVLDRWPALSFAATLRAGVENIDTAALERRGVALVNNAGRNANAVAEFTVAAILGLLRRIGENHHYVRRGDWRPPEPAEGYQELAGKTIGLVGLGAIGSLVTRRLSGFDLRFLVSDPFTDLSGRDDVTAAELTELLPASDVVSLHARLTPETHHLIGARELDLLRPHAVLVNTARAELVDEAALVERLADGRIAGAALDVFSVEPLPAGHPLRTMPTVALSPHLAGATAQATSRAPELLANRIVDLLGDR